MAGPLTIAEITRVAVDVVRTHSFPVKVLGSVPVSGGSNYVEILVRLDGPTEDRRMRVASMVPLRLTALEAVLVNLQRPNLRLEGRSRHAEPGGGTVRP